MHPHMFIYFCILNYPEQELIVLIYSNVHTFYLNCLKFTFFYFNYFKKFLLDFIQIYYIYHKILYD